VRFFTRRPRIADYPRSPDLTSMRRIGEATSVPVRRVRRRCTPTVNLADYDRQPHEPGRKSGGRSCSRSGR
jgi:hypothetical protein